MSYLDSDKNYATHLLGKKTELTNTQNQSVYQTGYQPLVEQITKNLAEFRKANFKLRSHEQLQTCKDLGLKIKKNIKELEVQKPKDQMQAKDKRKFIKKIKADFENEMKKLEDNAKEMQLQLQNQREVQKKKDVQVQQKDVELSKKQSTEQHQNNKISEVEEYKQDKLSIVSLRFQEDIMMEREGEIRNIERDILEISEMMKDTASLVKEQGDQLYLIEDLVEKAEDNTGQGNVELVKTQNIQKRTRRKLWVLLAIIIVVTVVVLAIALSYFQQ